MASKTESNRWPGGYDTYKDLTFRRPFTPSEWKSDTNRDLAKNTLDEFKQSPETSFSVCKVKNCKVSEIAKSLTKGGNSKIRRVSQVRSDGSISLFDAKPREIKQAFARPPSINVSALNLAPRVARSPSPTPDSPNTNDQWEEDDLMCNMEDERESDPENFRDSTSPREGASSAEMEMASPPPTSPKETAPPIGRRVSFRPIGEI
jgi:hypothetical protein